MLIIYNQAVRLPTRTGDNNLKNNHRIKLIAASLALTTSLSAVGGLGGLNVQSNLGEPFSGTVTVTGEEAKVLLNGGNASLSDSNLRTSVRKSGDKAVINIRSNTPINDPVLVFQVGVGSQSRQYTAIIDPADYAAGSGSEAQSETKSASVEQVARQPSVSQRSTHVKPNAKQAQEQTRAKKENKKSAAHAKVEKSRDVAPVEQKPQIPLEGDYKVRHGETLTFIAERIRPQGLTLNETINALVLANPKVFPDNNPDIVIAGSTLSIPSASALKDILKQGGAAAVKPAETTSVETQQPAQASQPDAVVEKPVVTEKTPETAGVGTSASSEPVVTAAKDEQASAAVSQKEVAKSEVTDKPETTASSAQAPATQEGESSGWWRWLLFAGLGAIALWLIAKAASKKKVHVEKADENDHFVLKEATEESKLQAQDLHATSAVSPVSSSKTADSSFARSGVAAGAAIAAGTATQAKATEEGLDVEDDFDDEIFFTETETIPADKPENNFSLDLGSIDRAQNGIVSGALTQDEETQKRQNANWDTIESTESVYEPEPENEYQHVAVEFSPVADTTEISDVADVADISVDEHQNERNDFDVDVESIQLEADSQEEKQAVQEVSAFETSSFVSAEETADEIKAVEFEPLEFDSSASEELQKSVEDTSSIDSSTVVEAEAITVESEEVVENIDQTETQDSSFFVEQAVESEINQEWVAPESDNNIAFQDEELGTPVDVSVSDGGETIEWESIEVEGDSEHAETGFISESVGMTAPLEAKYELAQMYVEIGDPDAAKETLQELLEEASGSILEKTKNMLAELDK